MQSGARNEAPGNRTTRTQTSSSRSAGPARDPSSIDPPPNPRTQLTHPTGHVTETQNKLAANTNEDMIEDGDVHPRELSANTNEDGASDDG